MQNSVCVCVRLCVIVHVCVSKDARAGSVSLQLLWSPCQTVKLTADDSQVMCLAHLIFLV